MIHSDNPNTAGIYAASLENPEHRLRIADAESKAIYAPPHADRPGYLLWTRDGTLMAQRFDTGRLRLEGEPVRVAEDVLVSQSSGQAAIWVSNTGLLLYRTGALTRKSRIVWIGRDGTREEVGQEGEYTALRLSPDGKKVALSRLDAGNQDIWVYEFARGTMARLTFDPAPDSSPVWSPDGREVAFASLRGRGWSIYKKAAGGGSQEQSLLDAGASGAFVEDWSRDGSHLLYAAPGGPTQYDLWALPLAGDRRPFPWVQGPAIDTEGAFSPDGKWIAYASTESRLAAVYVRPWSGAAASGGKWQISTERATHPRWRGDGRELFFQVTGKIMGVGIRAGAAGIEPEIPRELVAVTAPTPFGLWTYDVTTDGQRFLVLEPVGRGIGIAPLTVVTNWQARLKK